MELILLNAEGSLQFARAGGLPQRNGYLTRLTLREGEACQFTLLRTGQTFPFVAEAQFLWNLPPHYRLWQGEGYLFLFVKGERAGQYRWLCGKRLPPLGDFPFAKEEVLATGQRLFTFTGGEAPHRGAPVSKAYALFSPENALLFYGVGSSLKTEGERFTVTRLFPTHRAHRTVTVRALATGQVLSYTARPTRWQNPALLPHALTPVLFAEEIWMRAAPEDFLCRSLLPRAKDFFAFFGEFCFALPWEGGQLLLFRPEGGVARVSFSLREGLICDAEVEEP